MKYHIELDPALVQLASVFDKAELTLYLSGESLRAKIRFYSNYRNGLGKARESLAATR